MAQNPNPLIGCGTSGCVAVIVCIIVWAILLTILWEVLTWLVR